MSDDVQSLRDQLQQLKQLHASGTLTDAQYEESKTRLEQRVLDLVLAGAPATSNLAAATPAVAAPSGPAAPAARPSKRLVAAAAAFVVVVAAAGYAWVGSPALMSANPAVASADAGAANPDGAQHTMGMEQIAAMVDRLAQRMKDNPNDAEGWGMLGRSYTVMGRHAEALPAYRKALELVPQGDPALLADYADSLAVTNQGRIEGEPLKLVERALKLDPDNTKALSLAGTAAYNRKDYAGAAKYWERIITAGKADPNLIEQVRASVNEARQLAGLPPSTAQAPAPAAVDPRTAMGQGGGQDAAPAERATAAAAGPGFVAGTVSLSAALAGKARPDDTVFIFARAAQGPRMPLAVLRKQVKDLPVSFKLDDSMAMTPQMTLSKFEQVVVGARISKAGDPMPKPGDLEGVTAPVKLGSSDLKIEIGQVIGQ